MLSGELQECPARCSAAVSWPGDEQACPAWQAGQHVLFRPARLSHSPHSPEVPTLSCLASLALMSARENPWKSANLRRGNTLFSPLDKRQNTTPAEPSGKQSHAPNPILHVAWHALDGLRAHVRDGRIDCQMADMAHNLKPMQVKCPMANPPVTYAARCAPSQRFAPCGAGCFHSPCWCPVHGTSI
jgi:hypothetical protein